MEYIKQKIRPDFKLLYGTYQYRNDQVMRLAPDITKAKKEFNWNPKVDIFKGINELIKYHRNNENN